VKPVVHPRDKKNPDFRLQIFSFLAPIWWTGVGWVCELESKHRNDKAKAKYKRNDEASKEHCEWTSKFEYGVKYNPPMKRNSTIPLLVLPLLLVAQGCYSPTREIPLNTVSQPDVSLPNPANKREGTLSLQVTDTRAEKPKVGKMGGRIGANAIFVISGGLELRMVEILKDALERAGYGVAPTAKAKLEAEILEFKVYANGWTQGAQETIRFHVRNRDGGVLWEKTVKGQDGGMDLVDTFAEKSMNVALTRLLTNAIQEFESESFYQAVQKSSGEKWSSRLPLRQGNVFWQMKSWN